MGSGLLAVCVVLVVMGVGTGMLYLLLCSCTDTDGETEPQQGLYTILPYRAEDTAFEQQLQTLLKRVRWMDAALLKQIYVVNWNVPEEQTAQVREICEKYADVVYCSRSEFLEAMEKTVPKRDCNLCGKRV